MSIYVTRLVFFEKVFQEEYDLSNNYLNEDKNLIPNFDHDKLVPISFVVYTQKSHQLQ